MAGLHVSGHYPLWLDERPGWPGGDTSPGLLLNRRGGRLPGRGASNIIQSIASHAGLGDGITAHVFSAAQDVHDSDVRSGHVDPGIPGIWRRVGGHGGGDLVTVSRRGEQLDPVSVAGPVAGMAVPGTGGR